MFTGIIETTATLLEKTDTGLTVERPASFADLKMGSSIAVAGVCLSVIELTAESMRFDVVGETWTKTTLGDRRVGDAVNLERSLPANGRFEGHIVQGHVEGTAVVEALRQEGQWTMLSVRLPADTVPLIVPKGSIAIDGVSLTIASLDGDLCTIALIPHTLAVTTLGTLKPGIHVNIETDVLGRYVRRLLDVEHPSH